VLKTDGRTGWVDAYDGASLRLVERRAFETVLAEICADRLLFANGRIAVVCLLDGRAAGGAVGGAVLHVRLAPGELAGAGHAL
jgi:hypothetical protein